MYSQGKLERGKRQFGPMLNSTDEMGEEESTEYFYNTLQDDIRGQPSKYEMLQERDRKIQEMKQEMYLKSVGGTLPVSLLERGKKMNANSEEGQTAYFGSDLNPITEEQFNNKVNIESEDPDEERDVSELFGENAPEEDPEEFRKFMKSIQGVGEFDIDKMLKSVENNDAESLSSGLFSDDGDFDLEAAKKRYGYDENTVDDDGPDDDDDKLFDMQALKKEFGNNQSDSNSNNSENDSSPDNMDEIISQKLEKLKSLNSELDENVSRAKSKGNAVTNTRITDSDAVRSTMGVNNKKSVAQTPLSRAPYSNPVLCLLDNEELENTSQSPAEGKLPVIPLSEIDKQWNLVHFNRCPPPDYSERLVVRRENNRIRANALYEDMLRNGVAPDDQTLTAFMSVCSEACLPDEAKDIMENMQSRHNLSITSDTYRHLIRMDIFLSNYETAIQRLKDMKGLGMVPDAESYGIVIQSLSHRDKLVEAIQIFEEAVESQTTIPEEHIKKLRARCEKFGIKHPNIPPDPDQWAKDVKDVQRRYRTRSQSVIQPLKSLTFV